MLVTYYEGSDVSNWRNGTDLITLSVEVFSVDQNRPLADGEAKGMVWVTKDGSDYENVTTLDDPPWSDASGFINHTFNFTCDYAVGEQYWRIEVVDNTDYKDTNVTGDRNVTVETYLNGSINQPSYQVY
ncbi:MAG: hypothetical protein KAT35_02865, partial [Candidatus Aenigmarchaeota archaeon]|nr:hypothetical protein [Candidatus Aenigmarchaeota archaeon]